MLFNNNKILVNENTNTDVVEDTSCNMNEIMNECLLASAIYHVEVSEIIHEAESVAFEAYIEPTLEAEDPKEKATKGMIEKAKAFIDKMIAAIKAMFQRFMNWMILKIKSNDSFIKDNEESVSKLSGSIKLPKNFFDAEKRIVDLQKVAGDAIKAVKTNREKAVKDQYKDVKSGGLLGGVQLDTVNGYNTLKALAENIPALSFVNSVNLKDEKDFTTAASAVSASTKQYILGEEVDTNVSGTQLLDVLKSANKTLGSIKTVSMTFSNALKRIQGDLGIIGNGNALFNTEYTAMRYENMIVNILVNIHNQCVMCARELFIYARSGINQLKQSK